MLNYQTDSSDEGNNSDDDDEGDDLGMMNLEKQKRGAATDDAAAWGKTKGGYYKGDSDSDEGSENEEDLAKEALRLQKIRQ